MSTRLLLVRHGQTEWNATGRFQGQSDEPLNETGMRQAQEVGKRLAAWLARGEEPPIRAIYASDRQRAWRTAEIIRECLGGGTEIPISGEPRLREMCFGEWEGLTYAEIQQQQRELLDRWRENVERSGPPGGETLVEVASRVEAAYAAILGAHPEGTVLIVAHGGSLQIMIAQKLGLPLGRYWQLHLANGSLSELAIYPEGAILNLLNSREHLEW